MRPKKSAEIPILDGVVGDLVVALDGTTISAIEQVSDGWSSSEIIDRWRAQGVIGPDDVVQIWEARAGFHFRLRGTA